jgi:hypothetical protein
MRILFLGIGVVFLTVLAWLPAGQPPRKHPPPLTDADLQKMSPQAVKDLFKMVALPEDDPDPDAGNQGKKGAPSTGEIKHSGMNFGPCLACTVDLPDPAKKKNDEAGKNVILRGLVVKLPHDVTVCYDLDTLAVGAVWQGGFLDLSKTNHENSKGMMAPQVPWPVWFTNIDTPGCADKDGKFDDPRPGRLGPLPASWLKYHGHSLHGDQVILSYNVQGRDVREMPGVERVDDSCYLTRTFWIGAGSQPLRLLIASGKNTVDVDDVDLDTAHILEGETEKRLRWLGAVVVGQKRPVVKFLEGEKRIVLTIAESSKPVHFKVVVVAGDAAASRKWWRKPLEASAPAEDLQQLLTKLMQGSPKRWGSPLTTKGTLSKDNGKYPYVVDTLTVPFDNPYKSWMRTAAFDFFSDGRMAVSTLDGDVWIVSGIDDKLDKVTWQRFATGLYEPLGLKIVKDQIYVLGRDRITRLHDLNGDGEADFYESFWHDGNVAPSFHAFSFDLQTDKAGNFYFVKSGRRVDKQRPGHGAVIKVSPDGKKSEIVATGFRHPNGMGIGPNDEIVVSDNQGEWVPASKVNLIQPGGFYGYARKDEPTPTRYDPPLFWLPMDVDNSSGGQCWATTDQWGPLNGKLLHTSYGACSLMYALTQKVGATHNAAVIEMPFLFRSGIMRARVNPKDGQVYVVGLRGWQTKAQDVGCVERVRWTGKPACLVTNVEFHRGIIRIQFSAPVDPETLKDPKSYKLTQWNYIWSRQYGSPHMSAAEPMKVGHDTVEFTVQAVSKDNREVVLSVPELQPVHQIRIRVEGTTVRQVIYATINAVGES